MCVQVNVVDLPGLHGFFTGPTGDPFAVGVLEVTELERRVAGVPDDDFVFHRLTDLARQFVLRERGFAFDALELFDRESGATGSVGWGGRIVKVVV